jgi:hypothetical protein
VNPGRSILTAILQMSSHTATIPRQRCFPTRQPPGTGSAHPSRRPETRIPRTHQRAGGYPRPSSSLPYLTHDRPLFTTHH